MYDSEICRTVSGKMRQISYIVVELAQIFALRRRYSSAVDDDIADVSQYVHSLLYIKPSHGNVSAYRAQLQRYGLHLRV